VTFNYYPETDSLYINLSPKKSAHSVGIDIDHASSKVDLTQLTIDSLPLSGLSMTKAGYGSVARIAGRERSGARSALLSADSCLFSHLMVSSVGSGISHHGGKNEHR